MRKALAPLVAAAVVAVPAAAADGGPLLGVSMGWNGIRAGSAPFRYVTLPAVNSTAVATVRLDGGRVDRFGWIRGVWGIPFVTAIGTTGGLSADGRTLVLAQPARFPAVTHFALFDTRRFRVTGTVAVRGAFSFDAMSPDARTLFLTEHLSASDPTYYRIRTYDVAARRLLPQPVVDRTAPDEQMRGQPLSRATGPGSRWVYTLYAGGAHPFVHALDTVGRRAFCLDFEWSGGPDALWRLRLALSRDGRRILIARSGKVVLTLAAPS